MFYFKQKFYLVFNLLRNISLVMVITFITLAISKINPASVLSIESNDTKPAAVEIFATDDLLRFESPGETEYVRIKEIMTGFVSNSKTNLILTNGEELEVSYPLKTLWADISQTNLKRNFVKFRSKLVNFLYIDEIHNKCGEFQMDDCHEIVFDNDYTMSISVYEQERLEEKMDNYIINF